MQWQQQLWKAVAAVVAEAEELVVREDSSRSADIARKAEGGMGIEDEVEDEVEDEDELGVDAAAVAGMGSWAAGSVGRTGASMGVVAEVAVGSARQHAPWSPVCLEGEELG